MKFIPILIKSAVLSIIAHNLKVRQIIKKRASLIVYVIMYAVK